MYCYKCGKKIPDEAIFCPFCGIKSLKGEKEIITGPERLENIARIKRKKKQLEKYTKLIAAGSWFTIGVNMDGTVVATGTNREGQCDVGNWKEIIAVCAGQYHTAGLKRDGTVTATGSNEPIINGKSAGGRCDVSGWTGIIDIATGSCHTVGLKRDGTVLATGYDQYNQCNVSGWKDIVSIAAGGVHTVGLKIDGTVVSVGLNIVAHDNSGQCNTSTWRRIIAVAAGESHTVGLKEDGTVVAVGDNSSGECNIDDWSNIVGLAAGNGFTIGLHADGSVIATGKNDKGQCNTNGWNDIVAVAAGSHHAAGLRTDGTLIATGSNEHGPCDVEKWDLLNRIDTVGQECTVTDITWQENQKKRALLTEKIRTLCNDFIKAHDQKNFHVSPSLKQNLGIESMSDDKIFLARDDTLIRSGKNGFVITTEGIYCREMASKANHVSFNDLANAKVIKKKFSGSIYADKVPVALSTESTNDLLRLVNDIVKVVRETL